MLADRYGTPVSTSSSAARDAYVEGVDLFFAAQAGVEVLAYGAEVTTEGLHLARRLPVRL